ncbi:MAG: multisubunit potassium/proton antiporter, PhaE subunit [Roseomonas sp.]|jgi:multicomponent K+:H+ antiporter subunit E|nr:multisubunit potassium/proton antiporter, PhaE subunit [Roseomonas sp.]
MRRLLPHPIVSAALFVMWLLLNESIAPGPMLVGAVLAVLGGWALALLKPGRTRLRRLGVALRLAGVVVADLVRSNIAVTQVILHRRRDRRAGFLRIHLTLRNPQALAVLACILTATPGTAWVEYDTEDGWLLLHVLDLIDEASWVSIVKDRYERPLMEIFQ